MQLLINLIPILFILIGLNRGWRHGVIYELLNILRFFISLWLVNLLIQPIQKWIMALPAISSYVTTQTEKITGNLDYLDLGSSMSGWISSGINTVVGIVLFLLLFILISMLLKRLVKATRILNHIPLLGTVNRFFGALLCGVYFAYLVSFIYVILFWLSVNFGFTTLAAALGTSFWTSLI